VSDHDRWADAAAAFLLGAMPEDEKRAFVEHLDGCEECRREVDDLLPAAESLPMATMQVTPPPALKDRIMADVEREASLLAQTGPEADRPPRRRRSWFAGWRLAPVAAALLVAGVLAGVALDRAADGGAQTYPATVDDRRAPDASAEVRLQDDEATLVASNLPAPPSGRVYQVWVLREGEEAPEPTDALFLPRGDGSAVAMVPGDMSDAAAVLVTDEPEGGSDAPTRAPLVNAPMS
jgi:Anti-sigma-K factor rskA/Putative zinc-finger